jgi:hypothetical protein
MRKLKLYLDTSVINFIYADDAPEKQKVTVDFFENIVKLKKYNTYVSDIVYLEIEKTNDEIKKRQLLKLTFRK